MSESHVKTSDYRPNSLGVGRLLAKVGTYLTLNHKDYQSVDFMADTHTNHAFYVQGVSIGGGFAQAILGQKISTAQSLVGRLVGDDKLTAISESVYEKIAELSEIWAIKTLPKDPKTLTAHEKNDLAQYVANQNRTLAVIGGATGLLGLKGVVADTAWLLLVALRTVYQLAYIYEKPLTGKDGIGMAYAVLAGANLDKMQEKQVILTTLALAQNVLHQAGQGSLRDELIKLSASNATLKDFDTLLKFTHLDKLTEKYGLDVDKLNMRPLRHLTALVSVGVGVYYNRMLIDEIIGTAMATFKVEHMAMIDYQNNFASGA